MREANDLIIQRDYVPGAFPALGVLLQRYAGDLRQLRFHVDELPKILWQSRAVDALQRAFPLLCHPSQPCC